MEWVDTHVHLHFQDYQSDLEDVLRRAHEAGVSRLINIGIDAEDGLRAIELAGKFPGVYAAVGCHPHDVRNLTEADLSTIGQLLKHERVVALGEIGLDFFRNLSPRDVQIQQLLKLLEVHKETGKPVIFHCRDAYPELLQVISEFDGMKANAVMHCFSSDAATMRKFLDLGFYIAFGGALTFKKNDALREACQSCPLDRLVLETDGPYLAPQPFRGKRNEPSYMVETAAVAAGLHGISLEVLAERTSRNAVACFSL